MSDDNGGAEFQLMEGWMFGVMMFPLAMAEIVRTPPANDPE
ncbi:hypothetical protein ACFQY5_24990 [Paeniroseomonas aquatica]|uniref:Uncharacterized protein n=1 Tax=Paeniroseomonas aquatica TaxID=373043 RepID=A0ABT8A9I4_9PROT|nr:hypothetical protein [Paeniroseomonas aquatica]MDN3566291.1 hypothetical protein [Paeniroseomonas aquatica]